MPLKLTEYAEARAKAGAKPKPPGHFLDRRMKALRALPAERKPASAGGKVLPRGYSKAAAAEDLRKRQAALDETMQLCAQIISRANIQNVLARHSTAGLGDLLRQRLAAGGDDIRKKRSGVRVRGYAATGAVTDQGVGTTVPALRDALPGFLKAPSLREMHRRDEIGRIVSATVDQKGLYVEADIVEPEACKKVEAGIYKGLSIAFNYARRGVIANTIHGLDVTEVSLVDRPANHECVFEVVP